LLNYPNHSGVRDARAEDTTCFAHPHPAIHP
jgi:hypothetical protein